MLVYIYSLLQMIMFRYPFKPPMNCYVSRARIGNSSNYVVCNFWSHISLCVHLSVFIEKMNIKFRGHLCLHAHFLYFTRALSRHFRPRFCFILPTCIYMPTIATCTPRCILYIWNLFKIPSTSTFIFMVNVIILIIYLIMST